MPRNTPLGIARSRDRKEGIIKLFDVAVAAAMASTTLIFHSEAQVRDDGKFRLRLVAFTEQPSQGTSGPTLLQVLIVNESTSTLGILNDLDSINIPSRVPSASEAIPDTDLIHVDFGVSGTGEFVSVGPKEAVKVTLLLNNEQANLLARVKQMKAAVKFRKDLGPTSEAMSVLLPASVYKTSRP